MTVQTLQARERPARRQEDTPKECLHRWVEAQAVRTPDADAVVFGTLCLTYAELNHRANRLARFLRARGIGPDIPVGICAESSPEMVIGLLAILKAGGAYLPLDPAYPNERIAFMLADAQAPLTLTQSRLRPTLPSEHLPDTICLDADAALWGDESAENLEDGAEPDDLAYIIYTSGSTGQPKGVLLAHRGACNNLQWRQENFLLTSSDRMLQTYSFSFDPSVWAIFWPLVAGATLVLPRVGGIADSGYLVQTLAEQAITVAGFGPAMLQTLLTHPEISSCHRLRHLFCGGETMPADLPRLVHARLNAEIHNIYGPTEATIDAACWTVPRGEQQGTIPIGYPVANTKIFLLDDDLHPVPDGEPGELYIAGAGLARGYLNQPGLTAERFLPSPFAPSARLYRTGDLARRGPCGEVHYLGRIDTQVKLRGFRIELGEIEAALREQADVLDAVVTLREDRPGEKRLVAYIVLIAGTVQTGADLRRFLSATLPAHMVPAAFVFLHEIPLTPSGKRDRNGLPLPGLETWERGQDFVAPQTPLQYQLAQIWEDLLEIRPIGIRDSFWDLGGHSLLAARLLDQISHACGQVIPMSALYEGDTVEYLAETLQRRQAAASAARQSKIATGGTRRPLFYLYGSHPLGGFYCHHLARHLSPEQPLTILHPPTERGPRPITIETMAAEYIQIVRASQPQSPYRLGGFCGSALVAYEMARQLTAQGEAVEFLALIEVHAINARLRMGLRRLAGSRRRFLIWQRLGLPTWAAAQSRWRLWKKRNEMGLIEDYDRAAAAYVPQPYAGSVHLFRAADDAETFRGDPVDLWREVAPASTLHNVRGTHLSCLLEHVGDLGASLGECLEALDQR